MEEKKENFDGAERLEESVIEGESEPQSESVADSSVEKGQKKGKKKITVKTVIKLNKIKIEKYGKISRKKRKL